jgi:hypothetical protein
MTPSKYLSGTQYAGLLHVGDVVIPGDREFPSFSRAGCAHHVDRMLAWMNPSDLSGVQILLGVLRFWPGFLIRGLFALADRHHRFPNPLATALRMINIGVKGLVMTLYYSDVAEAAPIFELIKWDAKIVERESTPGEGA